MVKVSIIIPCYNCEKNISQCIDSILKQTYSDFELIIINDGSKDKTIDILNKYKKIDKRIKIIDKENEGVSKTRNLGIEISSGKYIMFIDNDDYIDQDYVNVFVGEIEKTNSDVVVGGYKRVNSTGKTIFKKRIKNYEWSKYIVMAPWSKIYKKEFLIDNNIQFLSFPIGEDVYFIMKLIALSAKFHIIDYIGYTWYYNDESVSNTNQRGIKENINIIELLSTIKSFVDLDDQYNQYFFYKYCVWYLLFSGRSTLPENYMTAYGEYYRWLRENKCYNIMNPLSKKLKGESIRDRLSVLTFMMLDKFKLMGLFSKIYCKGK